ncbi:hypothetical protein LT85_3726 [Collimonas arenae]|uniref:Uncharacterized protein n=1 Tax=Collimonas arenae TaxID=279058 RepID=A0A0A1FGZ5_9BURK|nr:hypothetical protein LT85_3726 [Collimonas arenae]
MAAGATTRTKTRAARLRQQKNPPHAEKFKWGKFEKDAKLSMKTMLDKLY